MERGSYITAKRRIEHNILIREERVNITRTPSIERYDWQAPVSSHWAPARDISGNTTSREEPNVDSGAFPLHGINTPSDVVEIIAVGICSRSRDATSGIAIVLVAVGVNQSSAGL